MRDDQRGPREGRRGRPTLEALRGHGSTAPSEIGSAGFEFIPTPTLVVSKDELLGFPRGVQLLLT